MDIRRCRDHCLHRVPPRIRGAACIGRAGALAAVVLLAGCSLSQTFRDNAYVVQRGDTLGGIAADYGIDWHNLAAWNDIRPPYRLSVGQTLYLKPYPPLDYSRFSQTGPTRTTNRAAAPASTPTSSAPPHTTGRTYPLAKNSDGPVVMRSNPSSTAPTSTSEPADTPSVPAPSLPARNEPAAAAAPAVPAVSESQADSETAEPTLETSARIDAASDAPSTKKTPVTAGGPSEDGWQWPATGTLLRGYEPDDRHRGIRIGGDAGSSIYAASSGTVVYNGTGLQGYGRLIIIKHDAHYLSAYGFVRESLVEQGETVAAGAHIANMGLGPGNKPMVLFEIRKDGEPINPIGLLPDR